MEKRRQAFAAILQEDAMNIAICDDNREYINTMEDYLSSVKEVRFDYDVFESGEDLLREYETETTPYDAIFLDMEMKEIDGIETANRIRKFDKHVIIIFVTSHTKYMQKSFECTPFRFLVKPVSHSEIETVFQEVCQKLSEERTTFVFTENRNKIRLFCDDIIYFENQSHWILIHTKDEVYKICKSLSDLYEKLDHSMFIRVHSSYIVNLGYIRAIKNNDIELYNCDKHIPLSRSNKKLVNTKLINFKERKYLV